MAIDTQTKRRSVLQFLPLTLPPVPDGAIGPTDRMQASWLYGGIAPAAANVGTPDIVSFTLFVSRSRSVTSYVARERARSTYIEKERALSLER